MKVNPPHLRRSRQTWCRQSRQSILQIDCLRNYLDLGRLQTIAGSGDGDRAGGESGSDGHAVDAEFGVQVETVCGIDLSAVIATAPDCWAGAGLVDAGVVGGAAFSFRVEDFYIDEHCVPRVGLKTIRADDRRELDSSGHAGGREFLFGDNLGPVIAHGADGAGCELDLGPGEDPPTGGFEFTPADLPLTKSSTDSMLAMT